VYPPIVGRQRLGKHVSAATNTGNSRRIVGRVIFYAVRVLKSLWDCVCISLSLLGNSPVKTFPRKRRIVGRVFYAVRVVSNKSTLSILPQIFGFKKITTSDDRETIASRIGTAEMDGVAITLLTRT
jgi:hypothetical protein